MIKQALANNMESRSQQRDGLTKVTAILTEAEHAWGAGQWQRSQALAMPLFECQLSVPECLRVARFCLQTGNFERAQTQFERALTQGPVHPRFLRDLSALHWRQGNRATARHLSRRAAMLEPLARAPRTANARCAALRINAAENCHHMLRWNEDLGIYVRRLGGGHFATRHLVRHGEIDFDVAHACNDNLAKCVLSPDTKVIVNTIACPDLHAHALTTTARFLERHPQATVINSPTQVQQTTRDNNYQRMRGLDGVIYPPTTRVRINSNNAEVYAAALEIGYPLLARIAGTQTGESLARIGSHEKLRDYLAALPSGSELYLARYFDCRAADGLYRKTRAFFIAGQFYPVARLSNTDWQIHSGDRYRVMSQSPQHQIEEQDYLCDPEKFLGADAISALRAIAEAIDLDFFGIDFWVRPDGQVIVFEANAVMRHNFDHATTFPYTRPHLERISDAFVAMVAGPATSNSKANPKSPQNLKNSRNLPIKP
ncbi:MAG: hypothetical protein AAF384_07800 [Pseudomonadota bacterium]